MNYEAAFKVRDTEYLPSAVKNQLSLYSVDEIGDKTKLIGSLSYKIPNAADTDIYEIVHGTSKKDVVALFVNGLKRVVKRLTSTNGQLFAEVKLGLNPTYILSCGTLLNGQYLMDEYFYNTCVSYSKKGLLTADEMASIDLAHNFVSTQRDYEIIKNIIRGHCIIRWSDSEISQGFKRIKDSNGQYRKYTIEEGLQCKSAINIEGVYLNSDNSYVECSNYFVLMYYQEGKEMSLNIPGGMSPAVFIEGLKQSIYTLIYSKIGLYNPFKAIKRIFSLARFLHDAQLLKLAYTAISSQVGLLYALTSQLGTIAKVIAINNRYRTNISAIYKQLDTLRFNFQTVILGNFDNALVLSTLTDLLKDKDQSNRKMEYIREKLLEIIIHNKHYINEAGIQYLQSVGLFPLPQSLTPNTKPF